MDLYRLTSAAQHGYDYPIHFRGQLIATNFPYEANTKALEPMGRVSLRKMMGGATLYLDGTIFAIMVDGELWLKADAVLLDIVICQIS